MTQLESARNRLISPEMESCAAAEGVEPEFIRRGIEDGSIVLTRNRFHENVRPLAIGRGLRTKINANIGTSKDRVDIGLEIEKIKICISCGADTVMDLSTGGNIAEIRRAVIANSPLPVGTVPIYQAALETVGQKRAVVDMTADDLFRVIEENGRDGVDFITVHCGVTRESVDRLRRQGRVLGIVSRGGSMLAHWMDLNGQENPLYSQFDRLLEIAGRYDMVLSLGDGLRPGCLADATDRGQVQELLILGELTKMAREKGVQAMIEGPGHVPLGDIETNMALQKKLCNGAPFYVLGPLPTDIAPGYDHITSAIGGALAGYYGADFLCYVTPSEHLGLPLPQDVRDGVIVTKIAAHAADIARGNKKAFELDKAMSTYRKALDWKGQIECAIDPDKIKTFRKERNLKDDVCSMCGEFCSMKLMKDHLKKKK